MHKFMMHRAALALLSLFLMMLPPPVASESSGITSSQEDPILNDSEVSTWSWEWGARSGFTKAQCSGGDGVITITPGGNLAFKGRIRNAKNEYVDIPAKGGTWSYKGVESSTGKRMYDLKWSNDTDYVTLSKDGKKLEGRNGSGSGPCYVTGTRK
jgi:hypothetical protein